MTKLIIDDKRIIHNIIELKIPGGWADGETWHSLDGLADESFR